MTEDVARVQDMNVRAAIAYAGRSIDRPRYHANDTSRDVLDIAPAPMTIVNARADARLHGTTLDDAGFALLADNAGSDSFGRWTGGLYFASFILVLLVLATYLFRRRDA